MGSIYYQQSNDLDSLSNVSQFNSALNGKTYGLKKIGGVFYPDDIGSGGGGISGVIPDAGLYLDGVNRVGVLLPINSGLQTDSNGLSVKQGNNIIVGSQGVSVNKGNGFISSNTTLSVGQGNNILVGLTDVSVNKGAGFTTSNTALNIGQGNNILVGANNISVNKGVGFTPSITTLDIGEGAGIQVNANNVSVKYDNSTITLNGSGQLQATPSGPIPGFSRLENLSSSDVVLNGVQTNVPTGLTFTLNNNEGCIVYLSSNIDIKPNTTFDETTTMSYAFTSTGSTIGFSWGYINLINNANIARTSGSRVLQQATSNLSNTSGASIIYTIALSTQNGTGGGAGNAIYTFRSLKAMIYYFPLSPPPFRTFNLYNIERALENPDN